MFVRHLSFGVTHAFGETATDEQVFLRAAAPLVRLACSGGVAALFMYGQTGSGKTHTMSARSPLLPPGDRGSARSHSSLRPAALCFASGWIVLLRSPHAKTRRRLACAHPQLRPLCSPRPAAIESRAAAMFFAGGPGVAGGRGAVPAVEALRVEFLELVGKRSLDLLSPSKAEVTVKEHGGGDSGARVDFVGCTCAVVRSTQELMDVIAVRSAKVTHNLFPQPPPLLRPALLRLSSPCDH